MQNYYRFRPPFQNYRPFRKIMFYPNKFQNTNSFSSNINNFSNYSNNNLNNTLNINKTNDYYNSNKNSESNFEFKSQEKGKFSKNLPPNSDFVLDLFGLHLYFDDILILGLLFFLYKEDVKDEGLFLALIMLLIS